MPSAQDYPGALQLSGSAAARRRRLTATASTQEDDPGAAVAVGSELQVNTFIVGQQDLPEIAPLTDLFVVYNRGNRLAPRQEDSLSDLFSDTLDDPQVDSFVVKLRYRFGN